MRYPSKVYFLSVLRSLRNHYARTNKSNASRIVDLCLALEEAIHGQPG